MFKNDEKKAIWLGDSDIIEETKQVMKELGKQEINHKTF